MLRVNPPPMTIKGMVRYKLEYIGADYANFFKERWLPNPHIPVTTSA